ANPQLFPYTTLFRSRKFTTRDSYGVSLCRLANIPILIVSSEKNEMVERRMEKLNIDLVELGISNKLKVITSYCDKLNIGLKEVRSEEHTSELQSREN